MSVWMRTCYRLLVISIFDYLDEYTLLFVICILFFNIYIYIWFFGFFFFLTFSLLPLRYMLHINIYFFPSCLYRHRLPDCMFYMCAILPEGLRCAINDCAGEAVQSFRSKHCAQLHDSAWQGHRRMNSCIRWFNFDSPHNMGTTGQVQPLCGVWEIIST